MRNKGFTLIEVLIVVAIIAILDSMLLVGMGRVRQQGTDTRIIADLRNVANALELYANKCGYYPGLATGGVCQDAPATTWAELESSLNGANIGVDRIPHDLTGNGYEYARQADGLGYVLKGVLSDTGNRALENSWSGTLGAVSCVPSAGEYCIKI